MPVDTAILLQAFMVTIAMRAFARSLSPKDPAVFSLRLAGLAGMQVYAEGAAVDLDGLPDLHEVVQPLFDICVRQPPLHSSHRPVPVRDDLGQLQPRRYSSCYLLLEFCLSLGLRSQPAPGFLVLQRIEVLNFQSTN